MPKLSYILLILLDILKEKGCHKKLMCLTLHRSRTGLNIPNIQLVLQLQYGIWHNLTYREFGGGRKTVLRHYIQGL